MFMTVQVHRCSSHNGDIAWLVNAMPHFLKLGRPPILEALLRLKLRSDEMLNHVPDLLWLARSAVGPKYDC